MEVAFGIYGGIACVLKWNNQRFRNVTLSQKLSIVEWFLARNIYHHLKKKN